MTKKFVADAMLARLARYLRVAGYSVLYAPPSLADAEVLRLAESSGRILLTADRELYRVAKDYVPVVMVNPRELEKQLSTVKKELKLTLKLEAMPARCPLDDAELQKASKASVKNKVPEGVFRRQKEFWQCTKNDGHVYWKGAHWEKLKEKLR